MNYNLGGIVIIWTWGRSVSIMSGYEVDDRAIEVRSPAGTKEVSSSLCVQTGLEPTQPPVQWVLGVLSPG
jgi:hypothetical protein